MPGLFDCSSIPEEKYLHSSIYTERYLDYTASVGIV